MRQVVAPHEQSRNDYAVFSELAARLGVEDEFTEERDEMDWIEHLYEVTRSNATKVRVQLPIFEPLW